MEADPGAEDSVVAQQAKSEQAVLITFDTDFASILAYPPQEYFGIIRINMPPQLHGIIIKALKRLFLQFKTKKDFVGTLIIVEPSAIRIWGGSYGD